MKDFGQQFQYFSYSVTKVGKEKCGDSFAILESAEENLIILAVADGVSSYPCDWRASTTACETAIKVFVETGGSIAGRMKSAAGKAHNAIKSVNDSCRGMLTSLSLAVWEIGSNKIHTLNVGDSRIYAGTENDLRQITVDDSVSVLVKRGGEVILNAGMPVFMRGVTRSLGQSEPLTYDVAKHEFANLDLLVLVTDGICKNEAFTSELKDVFTSGNVSEKLKQVVRGNSEKNKDDATLVVLWRTEVDKGARAIYEKCFRENRDFREKDLRGWNVAEFLQSDLIRELSKNSNKNVNESLDYAARFRLKFSREFLSEFLSLVIKQGTDRNLATRLRDLVRTSVG